MTHLSEPARPVDVTASDPSEPSDPSGPGRAAQVWLADHDGGPVTRLVLAGEIDLATSPELDRLGRAAIERGLPVTLDVSAVTFMDSVGVGLVARLIIAGRAGGWRPTVVGAGRSVLETLTISGVLGAINLVPAGL